MENMNGRKVTSISEMLNWKNGELVKLPSAIDGEDFIVRLRRPSLMVLIKSGKIPNSLIGLAQDLFAGKDPLKTTAITNDTLTQLVELFDVICEASFVEPEWRDIKEAGITLNDEQYMEIFKYSQRGVKALESFREKRKDTERIGNSSNIQAITQ